MTENEILDLIRKLEVTEGDEYYRTWSTIRSLEIDRPAYFLKVYSKVRKWQDRVFLMRKSLQFARKSESAFQLGVLGLSDRATMVRHHAAAILAYSLREDAIPHLKKNLNHKDVETHKDADRAIRAIKQKNHHIYMGFKTDQWVVNTKTDRKHNVMIESQKEREAAPEVPDEQEESRFLRAWKSLLRW